MGKTLDEKLRELPKARKLRVKARTTTLIANEFSLRALRRELKLTQQLVAGKLGIGQESVSKIECRHDVLLSTLRAYVEALGGHLTIVAEFPDRPPVLLNGFDASQDSNGRSS